MLLGVDTGGTFTDFVCYEDGRLRVHKVLSTPQAPEQAILQGIAEMGLDLDGLTIVHGSTVATNAVLERKGVRTVYIANHGLGDVLAIGRQARKELYNLQPMAPPPPLPVELCLETGGRLDARGEVVEELDDAEVARLVAQVRRLQPEACAINLLFSFLDDRFEKRLEEALAGQGFVCRSSQVLPEYKEYERGMATFLNAYVGPLVAGYLQRLREGVGTAGLTVMQSSGDTMAADQAARRGVNMLLSGPAGGLQGATLVGRLAGCERLLTFDMGGTSTDVALVDGAIRLTSEGQIGGFPVAVPMVDMHTIGAGGGSLARVDAGGLLQVGPESAGARPGPACYGRGGAQATVTDANVVLGRLRPEAFLGGGMALDVAAAREAVAVVAQGLGCSIEEAALGIIRLADEHMAAALRVISVQRGENPRDFSLMPFGGAGGLHVCSLADLLGMTRAVVPIHGGVLSALGMLAAPRGRELSRTLTGLLATLAEEDIESVLTDLAAQGRAALLAEGVAEEQISASTSLDLRYRGQAHTLNLPWQGCAAGERAFHATHEQRYGHKLEEAVELVNVRLTLQGPPPVLELMPHRPITSDKPVQSARLHGVAGEVPVHVRTALAGGTRIQGPALVTETVSTTFIAPGWQCEVDEYANLLLEK